MISFAERNIREISASLRCSSLIGKKVDQPAGDSSMFVTVLNNISLTSTTICCLLRYSRDTVCWCLSWGYIPTRSNPFRIKMSVRVAFIRSEAVPWTIIISLIWNHRAIFCSGIQWCLSAIFLRGRLRLVEYNDQHGGTESFYFGGRWIQDRHCYPASLCQSGCSCPCSSTSVLETDNLRSFQPGALIAVGQR